MTEPTLISKRFTFGWYGLGFDSPCEDFPFYNEDMSLVDGFENIESISQSSGTVTHTWSASVDAQERSNWEKNGAILNLISGVTEKDVISKTQLLTKFECGNAYVIELKSGGSIIIPNFHQSSHADGGTNYLVTPTEPVCEKLPECVCHSTQFSFKQVLNNKFVGFNSTELITKCMEFANGLVTPTQSVYHASETPEVGTELYIEERTTSSLDVFNMEDQWAYAEGSFYRINGREIKEIIPCSGFGDHEFYFKEIVGTADKYTGWWQAGLYEVCAKISSGKTPGPLRKLSLDTDTIELGSALYLGVVGDDADGFRIAQEDQWIWSKSLGKVVRLSGRQIVQIEDCPIDCASSWDEWTHCHDEDSPDVPVDCAEAFPEDGVDRPIRTRSLRITRQSNTLGIQCPEVTHKREVCIAESEFDTLEGLANDMHVIPDCENPCVLGDWSNWTTCSSDCGGGTTTRVRPIISESGFGVPECPSLEDRTQTDDCNVRPCACADTHICVKGVAADSSYNDIYSFVGEYQQREYWKGYYNERFIVWQELSDTLGPGRWGGVKTLDDDITEDSPLVSEVTDYKMCPVDIGWSNTTVLNKPEVFSCSPTPCILADDWTTDELTDDEGWGPCSDDSGRTVVCGGGDQTRTKEIVQQPYGMECQDNTETRRCAEGSCNTPPVASDACILPNEAPDDIPPKLSILTVPSANYTYFDANGDPEDGSEIRWYKVPGEHKALKTESNQGTIFLSADGSLWGLGWFNFLNAGTSGWPTQADVSITDSKHNFYHGGIASAQIPYPLGAGYKGDYGDGKNEGVSDFSLGGSHLIYVKDGELVANGDHWYGQLGNAPDYPDESFNPTPWPWNNSSARRHATYGPLKMGVRHPRVISAGSEHNAIITDDGELWTNGSNKYDQLGGEGDGMSPRASSNNSSSYPRSRAWVKVQDETGKIISDAIDVSAGGNHTMFVREDGTLWGMGLNYSGQLGVARTSTPTGGPSGIRTPVQCKTDQYGAPVSDVVSVECGWNSTFFIKKDGSLWGMGDASHYIFGKDNTQYEVATGRTFERHQSIAAPVMIDDGKGLGGKVVSCTLKEMNFSYIKEDGSLWVWGSNKCLQCGWDGDTWLGNGPGGMSTTEMVDMPTKFPSGGSTQKTGQVMSADYNTSVSTGHNYHGTVMVYADVYGDLWHVGNIGMHTPQEDYTEVFETGTPSAYTHSGNAQRMYQVDHVLVPELNDLKTHPDASFTSFGDTWYYTIRPNDGTEFGEMVTSCAVVVDNTRPIATTPSIRLAHQKVPPEDCEWEYEISTDDGWGPCVDDTGTPVTCGRTAKRQRVKKIIKQGHSGGRLCDEDDLVETQLCNLDPCPVPCEWHWSKWTPCSGCGGYKTRTRIIDQEAVGMTPCPNPDYISTQSCMTDCVGGTVLIMSEYNQWYSDSIKEHWFRKYMEKHVDTESGLTSRELVTSGYGPWKPETRKVTTAIGRGNRCDWYNYDHPYVGFQGFPTEPGNGESCDSWGSGGTGPNTSATISAKGVIYISQSIHERHTSTSIHQNKAWPILKLTPNPSVTKDDNGPGIFATHFTSEEIGPLNPDRWTSDPSEFGTDGIYGNTAMTTDLDENLYLVDGSQDGNYYSSNPNLPSQRNFGTRWGRVWFFPRGQNTGVKTLVSGFDSARRICVDRHKNLYILDIGLQNPVLKKLRSTHGNSKIGVFGIYFMKYKGAEGTSPSSYVDYEPMKRLNILMDQIQAPSGTTSGQVVDDWPLVDASVDLNGNVYVTFRGPRPGPSYSSTKVSWIRKYLATNYKAQELTDPLFSEAPYTDLTSYTKYKGATANYNPWRNGNSIRGVGVDGGGDMYVQEGWEIFRIRNATGDLDTLSGYESPVRVTHHPSNHKILSVPPVDSKASYEDL